MHILSTGDTLNNGEFRIDKKIGEGGFGITYLATHIDLLQGTKEQVVIKEFFMSGCFREGTTVTTGSLNPAHFEKFKNSFLDEARLLYKFKNHKNIVNVRKFFNDNGTAYFAMDYVEGSDMEVYARSLATNRITEQEAIELLTQIGSALTAIHSQNYTHRDLKPQNILRHQNGKVYVLIDFGIARDFVVDESQVTSTIIKSEGYTPPEQYRQRVRRGDFTDVYGLAATLYRLLTGEKPTDALTRRDDLDDGILLPAPKKYNPSISPQLDAAIMKALELKPKDRFQTVAEFVKAATLQDSEKTAIFQEPIEIDKTVVEQVEEIKQKPISTPKPTPKQETPPKKEEKQTLPTKKQNRTPIFVGIGVFLLFVIGFGIYTLFLLPKQKNEQLINYIPKEKQKNEQLTDSLQDIEKNMVYVEGGSFMMGSNEGEADEKPIHKVTLSSFKVSKYEVTQAQWKAIMGNNPSKLAGCDNCPVENVSWNNIQVFLEKLNQLTGKNYRLPTEAEWEYAARGGNKSKGYKYAGSNSLGNVAWYIDNGGSKTHPVGQKQSNELGLYDMSGNVWEWCQDWYDSEYYEKSKNLTNPINNSKTDYRILRGGSSWDSTIVCRSVGRYNFIPSSRFNSIGFRICLPSI